MKKIFIVDDSRLYASMIENHLVQRPDVETRLYYTGEDCMLALDEENPDVILLDFHLNVDDETARTGYDYLQLIKDRRPNQAVVMLSSMEDVRQVVELLKTGAYDYVLKDDNAFEQLDKVLNNLNEVLEIREELNGLKQTISKQNKRFKWTLLGVAVVVTVCLEWLL